MGDMKNFHNDASTRLPVGETPDLFAEFAEQPTGFGLSRAKASEPAAGCNKVAQIDHLAAARKLQWQLRRTRSHSPEEVKTGRLICRHLLALLNEAADRSQGGLDAEHAAPRHALG